MSAHFIVGKIWVTRITAEGDDADEKFLRLEARLESEGGHYFEQRYIRLAQPIQ
jgi:hypothetical protein